MLVPVVLFLSVMATVAYLINMEGSVKADSADRALRMSQTAYAAEAAIAEATWRLSQNATCESYANLNDTTFDQYTYNASVGPTEGSPVVIQASATAADGTATVATRSARVYGPELTINLTAGATGKDAVIDKYLFNSALGGNDELWTSGDSTNTSRSLLKFDLSPLPTNVQIKSAVLELELYNLGSYETVTAHRVTNSWKENEVTWRSRDWWNWWDTHGGDFDTYVYGSFVTDATGIKSVNLTALVLQWINGTANHGVLLKSPTIGSASVNKYHSREKVGEFHPRLVVTYVCECGTPCAGAALAETVVISTKDPTTIGGENPQPTDLVSYDIATDVANPLASIPLSGSGDVDAVHQLNDGHLVISTAAPEIFGGISIREGDLIKYNNDTGTASIYLNASVFDNMENIDAVHVLDSGNLLISTHNNATLGGLSFTADDIVEYNPVSDTAAMYFNGSAFSNNENIDGFRVLESGNYLISTSGNANLGGLSFSDTDVVEYDPMDDTATLYLDEAAFANAHDVNALDHSDISAVLPPDPPAPAMCAATFIDNFLRRTYDGSDGNAAWATDWIEGGLESDGPTAGHYEVAADFNNYRLKMKQKNRRMTRALDLSGYTTATYSFNYRKVGFDGTNDKIFVRASADGSSYDDLDIITVPNDSTYQTATYDISAYISANTHIQFSGSAGLNHTDIIYIDNVLVCAD